MIHTELAIFFYTPTKPCWGSQAGELSPLISWAPGSSIFTVTLTETWACHGTQSGLRTELA